MPLELSYLKFSSKRWLCTEYMLVLFASTRQSYTSVRVKKLLLISFVFFDKSLSLVTRLTPIFVLYYNNFMRLFFFLRKKIRTITFFIERTIHFACILHKLNNIFNIKVTVISISKKYTKVNLTLFLKKTKHIFFIKKKNIFDTPREIH